MNFLVLKHGLESELRVIIPYIPTFGEFVSPMSALLHIHIIYGSFHGTFTTQKFFHMKYFLKCFLSNLNRYVFFYFAVI